MSNKNDNLRYHRNLIELLESAASKYPNQIAYTYLDDIYLDNNDQNNTHDKYAHTITYQELLHRVKIVAATLQNQVPVGERVILIYPPGLDFIIGFLSCLFAGLIAVPAYPPANIELAGKLQYVINDSKPALILAPSEIIHNLYKLKYLRWLDKITFLKRAAHSLLPNKLIQAINLSHFEFDKLNYLNVDKISERANKIINTTSRQHTIAMLQYTSGATTDPKGVIVSHYNLFQNLSAIQNSMKLTNHSISFLWLPPYHDMGLIGGILVPLYATYHSILISPTAFLKKPIRWLRGITQFHATLSGGPNFAYEICIDRISEKEKTGLDLSSLKVLFNGAEPVSSVTLDRFVKMFSSYGFKREQFYPCYGLTEATLMLSGGQPGIGPITLSVQKNALRNNKISINTSSEATSSETLTLISSGQSIENHQIYIVNPETTKICKELDIGEIWVAGPSVAEGYWYKTRETKEVFDNYLTNTYMPYLKTGDLGFIYQKQLYVTGRIKNLIIINGHYYYPQDIEVSIEQSHPLIRRGRSAAFSVMESNKEQLIIVVEIREQIDQATANELFKIIRQTILESYGLHAFKIILSPPRTIQKTTSGKIRHNNMRKLFLDNKITSLYSWESKTAEYHLMSLPITRTGEYINELELQNWLKSWLAKQLQIDIKKINTEDHFYHFGIDSIQLMQLSMDIEKFLNIFIDNNFIWEHETIGTLSRYLMEQISMPQPGPLPHQASISPFLMTSYTQQSLWDFYQLNPQDSSYNIHRCIKLSPEVNLTCLKQAFRNVIARHAILRCHFLFRNDQLVQSISSMTDNFWTEVNFTEIDEEKLITYLTSIANQAHILEEGNIFKLYLIQKQKENYLLLTAHQIIIDFYSLNIILTDAMSFYSQLIKKIKMPLPNFQYDYHDYIEWQQQLIQSYEWPLSAEFWKDQLRDEPLELNLPFDKSRPSKQSKNSKTIKYFLETELTSQLNALGNANNTTLFCVVLTALFGLIHLCTHQNDIIIGVPVLGRAKPEFINCVGNFMNILPIRAKFTEDYSFIDLLKLITKLLAQAQAHQDYPMKLMTKLLKRSQQSSYSRLFQVVMNFDEFYQSKIVGPDFQQSQIIELENENTQRDLTLTLIKSNHDFKINFEFNINLFDALTIQKIILSWDNFLKNIIANPGILLHQLTYFAKP